MNNNIGQFKLKNTLNYRKSNYCTLHFSRKISADKYSLDGIITCFPLIKCDSPVYNFPQHSTITYPLADGFFFFCSLFCHCTRFFWLAFQHVCVLLFKVFHLNCIQTHADAGLCSLLAHSFRRRKREREKYAKTKEERVIEKRKHFQFSFYIGIGVA